MSDQRADQQEQNPVTQARNEVNHALTELNQARKTGEIRSATQNAHEHLDQARLQLAQARNAESDTQETT